MFRVGSEEEGSVTHLSALSPLAGKKLAESKRMSMLSRTDQVLNKRFSDASHICELAAVGDVDNVRKLSVALCEGENLDSIIPFCIFFIVFAQKDPVPSLETIFNAGISIECPVPRLPSSGIFSASGFGIQKADMIKDLLAHRIKKVTSASVRTEVSEIRGLCTDLDLFEYDKTHWFRFIMANLYRRSPDRAVEVLCFLASHMNSNKALKYLRECSLNSEMEPPHLLSVGEALIESSDFPIITCLELAHLSKELSKTHLIDQAEYIALYKRFTMSALNMIEDFPTDHHAAFGLTEVDALYHSALYVALKSRNTVFLGNVRVSRIINTMWSEPDFMKSPRFSSNGRSNKELALILLLEPKKFFLLPFGKFVIQSFSFIIFLALYSVLVVAPGFTVNSSVSPLEVTVWVMAFGYMIGELGEIYKIGAVKYFQEEWNRIDIFIYIGFLVIISIRMSCVGKEVSDATIDVFGYWSTFNAVLLWIRLTYVFLIHPTLGPLLRTTVVMARDLRNFAIISCLVMIGFGVAFYFLLSDHNVVGFQTLSDSLLTMFRGFLGDFDYFIFQKLDRSMRSFVEIMFSVYLTISAIVLINLLIAMMSKTYGEVQQVSFAEYSFGKAHLTWVLDVNSNDMPPPFNIVSHLVYFLSLAAHFARILGLLAWARLASGRESCSAKASTRELHAGTRVVEFLTRTSSQDHNLASMGSDTVAILGNPTSRESLSWPWICGHCHFKNLKYQDVPVVSSELNARRRSNKSCDKDTTLWKGGIGSITKGDLVSENTVICMNCYRVAHPIGEWSKFRELVSFAIFLVLLWIPLIICAVLPYSVFLILDNLLLAFDYRETLRRKKVHAAVERLPVKTMEQMRKQAQKQSYVRNLFESSPVTMEQLSGELVHLRRDLERIISGKGAEEEKSPEPRQVISEETLKLITSLSVICEDSETFPKEEDARRVYYDPVNESPQQYDHHKRA